MCHKSSLHILYAIFKVLADGNFVRIKMEFELFTEDLDTCLRREKKWFVNLQFVWVKSFQWISGSKHNKLLLLKSNYMTWEYLEYSAINQVDYFSGAFTSLFNHFSLLKFLKICLSGLEQYFNFVVNYPFKNDEGVGANSLVSSVPTYSDVALRTSQVGLPAGQ